MAKNPKIGRRPTEKQQKYVKGLAKGKSKYQAAKDAGYCDSMAAHAGRDIENSEALRALFRKRTAAKISMDKIITRLDEGIDATRTRIVGHGEDAAEIAEVDFEQRGKYLDRAVKWAGYYIDKQELEVDDKRDNPGERLASLLERAAERARTAHDARGAGGNSPNPAGGGV